MRQMTTIPPTAKPMYKPVLFDDDDLMLSLDGFVRGGWVGGGVVGSLGGSLTVTEYNKIHI